MASHEEIARHLCLSAQAVGQMVRSGRLPAGSGRAGLDLDACREAYLLRLRAVAAGRGGADAGPGLTAERARLAKEQADAQAMRNAARRGALLEAEDVEREWAAILRDVRSALLAVSSRVWARLPQLGPGALAVIDGEVREALRALGEGEGGPEDDGSGGGEPGEGGSGDGGPRDGGPLDDGSGVGTGGSGLRPRLR